MVAFIADIQAQVGKPKFDYEHVDLPFEMLDDVAAIAYDDVKVALDTNDKNVRDERLQPIYDKVYTQLEDKYPDSKVQLDECMYKLQKRIVREWLLEGKRVDGRGMDEIRPLSAEVGLLPRVHGSGLFTRRPDPRCFPSPPWAPSGICRTWTAWTNTTTNAICTTTTSPPTASGRPVLPVAPAVGKSATAP